MTSHGSDELFLRVHDLVTAQLEGCASQAERQELDALVRESDAGRRLFCDYMSETAHLRWHASVVSSELLRDLAAEVPRSTGRGWLPRTAGILASLGITAAILLMTIWSTTMRPGPVRQGTATAPLSKRVSFGVATLTRTAGVQWSDGCDQWSELSRVVPGDRLAFDRGELEVVFDIGVDVVIRGPAVFEVRAFDRAYSGLGKITARVGKTGEGFVLETPAAKVIDLGTEFSVEVTATGATDVAVIRGLVDISAEGPERDGSAKPWRLRQGEALQVDMKGSFNRVMTIPSDRFPTRAGDAGSRAGGVPVIMDVRDNGAANVRKFYRIVRTGLHEDSPAFVDRNHQWNGVSEAGIPDFLAGIEYVMPYNDDKFLERLELSIELGRAAVLYVFLSDNVPAPRWLTEDFIDTGIDIGLDEASSRFKRERSIDDGPGRSIDTVFSVWQREIPEATTVTLGPIQMERGRDGSNMYGIAAAPLVSTPGGRASAAVEATE